MTRSAFVLFILALFALTASCRQLADIEEQPACAESAAAEQSCDACVRAECCDEAAACLSDASCAAAAKELDGCQSDDCRTSVSREQAAGFGAALAKLSSCRARRCSEACGVTCGGYVFGSGACAECSAGACCDEATACGQNAECLALAYCEKTCRRNDHTCRNACEQRHAAGIAAARALADCAAAGCASACGYAGVGPDWKSCPLGPSAFVPGKVEFTHTLTIKTLPNANHLAQLKSLSGATLRACSRAGGSTLDCKVKIGSDVTTDTGGIGTITGIPLGSLYYLMVEGGIDTPVHSFLYYPDPPPIDFQVDTLSELSADVFPAVYAKVATIDPERGHLLLRAVDCNGQDAPGVSYYVDPVDSDATAFYGRFADVPGVETVEGDSHGGFLNLTARSNYGVIARRRDTGTCVAKRTVVVRKGFRTILSPMIPGGCPPE